MSVDATTKQALRRYASRYEEPGFIAPLDASTVSPRGRGRPAAMYRVIPKNER